MGSMVHETLEKLYTDLRHKKLVSAGELIRYYNDLWKKNWNKNIIIVKKDYTQENYRQMGQDYILSYYQRHQPFETKTIAVESRILLNLDKAGKYKIQGYIDRLDQNEEGIYEIHDYKTSGRLPTQAEIEKDRQLALYSIYVRENYPDCRDVKLRWHYLAFDKTLETVKTKKELDALRKEMIEAIKKIEREKEFNPVTGSHCDWCEFKPVCPKWSHLYEIEGKKPSDYLKDDGVRLVNKYAEIYYRTRGLNRELEQLKGQAIKYARRKKVGSIFGSNRKLNVNVFKDIRLPSKADQEKLVETLKKMRKFREVSALDVSALKKVIKEGKWPSDVLKKLDKFVKEVESARVTISKFEREE